MREPHPPHLAPHDMNEVTYHQAITDADETVCEACNMPVTPIDGEMYCIVCADTPPDDTDDTP